MEERNDYTCDLRLRKK